MTAFDAARALTESVVLPADATAARQARALARSLCIAAGLSADVQETAVLLTSEAVTNAVVHGRSLPLLTVSAHPGGVRICVGDDSSAAIVAQTHDADAQNGRGIQLLESCADDWGVYGDGHGGKVVWFECSEDPRLKPPA